VYEELRKEYQGKKLDKASVADSPVEQLRSWIDDAAKHVGMDNAMALGTCSKEGQPTQRMVLLKDLSDRGLVFFTNYQSQKGADLAENPRASLLFYWQPLDRQVRVEGGVAKIAGSESDSYWSSRPRASNLSAIASPQSSPVESREILEAAVAQMQADWEGRDLERPKYWGGYRLVPSCFEFWQGLENRLHDRICYKKNANGWDLKRLAP